MLRGLAFALVLLCGCEEDVLVDPLPVETTSAAKNWYQRQGVDIDQYRKMDAREAILRLNHAVYYFCKDGPAVQPDAINTLFETCVGKCGGRAHVLRGLLEVAGFRTRIANLHNIPIQGNHSMVEVWMDGRWVLADPTFGTAFSRDGHLLGLDDLRYELYGLDLGPYVMQASAGDWKTNPIKGIYAGTFDHPNMLLASYSGAEAVNRNLPDEMVILSIPLNLTHGSVDFGVDGHDLIQLSDRWLSLTNSTLADANPANDVSFNTSLFSTNTGRRATLIELSGLKPGGAYVVNLSLWSAQKVGRIQATPVGRNVVLSATAPLTVTAGLNHRSISLRSASDKAHILVRSAGEPTWNLRLFGVSASELSY